MVRSGIGGGSQQIKKIINQISPICFHLNRLESSNDGISSEVHLCEIVFLLFPTKSTKDIKNLKYVLGFGSILTDIC